LYDLTKLKNKFERQNPRRTQETWMELFGGSGRNPTINFFNAPCKIFKIPLKSAKTKVVTKSPLIFGKTKLKTCYQKNGQIPTVPAI
jgi:hypothetical protein